MSRVFRLAAVIFALAAMAGSQTPDEHASHHPAQESTIPNINQAASAAPVGSESAPVPGGGMAAGMGEMMKGMGAPPPKELYPSLMALPDDVKPAERAAIDQLARERMEAGTKRLASGLEKLSGATSASDFAAMQQATEQMREGLAEFEAGIAARRVLSEGKAPRNLALDWFKKEMNLASPTRPEERQFLPGVTPFHLFTMALLIAFSLAMLAMYFFKMRRAAALFGRLDADTNPPPGSLPSSGGGPVPSGPASPAKPVPSLAAVPVPPADPANTGDKPAAPPVATVSPVPAVTPPAVSEATSATPLTAKWKGHLRVGSIVTETPTLKTFRLLPSGHFLPFTFIPGQFLNVAFSIGGARMNRSYSIASSPTQREYVELAIRREPRGAVSRHIDDLVKVGDDIEAGGPIGRFTFTGTEADSIVLIAAGVGITPMMSITRYLTERSWAGDIFFLYVCRTPADFIFADEAAALQRLNPKLHVAVTLTRAEGTDWKGARGRISKEWLTQIVPDLASRRIHLCGPPEMMVSTRAILSDLGVPPESIKTEAFGAVKPTPAAAGTTAAPTAPATGPLVTFSKNDKSAKIHTDQTILELSEELGIGIEFSCRVGTCGICKVRMTAGEVEMEVQDALDNDDKTSGIILACQAKPTGEVAVEA